MDVILATKDEIKENQTLNRMSWFPLWNAVTFHSAVTSFAACDITSVIHSALVILIFLKCLVYLEILYQSLYSFFLNQFVGSNSHAFELIVFELSMFTNWATLC